MNIKKIVLFSLFIVELGVSFSQRSTPKFIVGIDGGVAGSTIRKFQPAPHTYKSLQFAFTGGVTFQYNFNSSFALKTNLNYVKKGSVVTYDDLHLIGSDNKPVVVNAKKQMPFNYLAMPILFQYSVGKQFQFLINIGGYWGFLFKATEHSKGKLSSKPYENSSNTTGNYYKLDFGLSGGIGASYQVSPSILITLEIRENYGLRDINPGGGWMFDDTHNMKMLNQSTSVLFGVAYMIGETKNTKRK